MSPPPSVSLSEQKHRVGEPRLQHSGLNATRNRSAQLPLRRSLSCLPCRSHKLKCNRDVPCESCVRRGRENECRLHPAPSAALNLASRASRRHLVSQNVDRSSGNGVVYDTPSTASDIPLHPESPCSSSHQLPNDSGRLIPNTPTLSLPSPATSTASINDEPNGRCKSQATESPSRLGATNVPWIQPPTTSADRTEQLQGWKQYFVSQVPSRFQCDMLLAYYFEHIGWIYQTIHLPTFRIEYSTYWASEKSEADLIWLSLLFMILAVAELHIPAQMRDVINIEATTAGTASGKWFSLSRQASQAGGSESKPSLTALQTFVVSQLYFYATRDVEMLNSYLGQAVRNAQALGLDKPTTKVGGLKKEMRHRIWWDICASDTSQTVTLNRQPLITSHLSIVPEQLNCNDVDLTSAAVTPRPIDEPTVMSVNICRTRVLRHINALYRNDGASLKTYDFVSKIDLQVSQTLAEFPTYSRVVDDSSCVELSPELECIYWQYHVIQTFVCLQTVRMYRPFLRTRQGSSWMRCIESAENAFTIYLNMRRKSGGFHKSQKFRAQVYQSFQAGVCLAMFLLVERPERWQKIRQDLETVVSDLEMLAEETVPVASEGRVIIRQILGMYDHKGRGRCFRPVNLVPGIQAVFGGEEATREYLEAHSHQSAPVEEPRQAAERTTQQQGSNTHENDFGVNSQFMAESSQPLMDFADIDPFEMPTDLLGWNEWNTFLEESYSQYG